MKMMIETNGANVVRIEGKPYANLIGLYECKPLPTAETPKWISVEDELPESHLAVLVWCPDRKNIFCTCYSAENKAWTLFGSFGYPVYEKITHWTNVPMHP